MRDPSPVTAPKRNPIHLLMSMVERRPASDRVVLRLLLLVILGSSLAMAIIWSQSMASDTPTEGGTLTEGVLGNPRFINPVLAVTRADQDVAALVFNGLMKLDESGTLVNDLAESVTVADDGLTYNVVLRKDITWHDGVPLTARDVSFTIGLLQNPDLKSPLRGNWADVTVEEINEYELNIILAEAYTPFIENFTVGIVPRHIWSLVPIEQIPFSQYNTEPIGSGPFALNRVFRDKTGLITTYELAAYPQGNQRPHIAEIVIHFYPTESEIITALADSDIDSSAYITHPQLAQFTNQNEIQIIEQPLPRIFTLFFNQNRSVSLRDTAARQALDASLNRPDIIDQAVSGYGVPTNAPVPPDHNALQSTSQEDEMASSSLEIASDILRTGGWEQNQSGNWEKEIDDQDELLSVTIQTANTEIFSRTAHQVADNWRELGVIVQIDEYEQSDILQSVIRTRDFQVLLFGLDMSKSVDLYPFWHSSQREDPGLNIAQYANIEVDALLQTARTTQDPEERLTSLVEILEVFRAEVPAIFLFVPTFTYVTQTDMLITPMTGLSRPQERFMNIHNWYRASDTVWPLFQ